MSAATRIVPRGALTSGGAGATHAGGVMDDAPAAHEARCARTGCTATHADMQAPRVTRWMDSRPLMREAYPFASSSALVMIADAEAVAHLVPHDERCGLREVLAEPGSSHLIIDRVVPGHD